MKNMVGICKSLLLANVLSLLFVANAFAVDVSGTVSYSGSKSGRVYITVKANNGYQRGTSISGPGAYTIRGVPDGSYTVGAFMDALDLGTQVHSSPAGSTSATGAGSPVTGVNISLADPLVSAPGQPTAIGVAPGDSSVLMSWNGARDSSGLMSADGYTVYWNTVPTVSKTSYTGSRTVPAGTDSPALIEGLTNGSGYYFIVVPNAGGIDGTASAVFGPTVVGAKTGGNTVSGTVNYTGPTASGPLYVAVVKPDSKGVGNVYFTKISNPSTSQTFSVSGVPNGAYEVFALYDMNNDKLFAAGDVTNTDDSALALNLTGSGASGLSISLVSSNAGVRISTEHRIDTGSTYESFSIESNMRSQLKRPVAAVLTGAPASSGLVTPADLAMDNGEIRYWSDVTTRPATGDVYTFLVTYTDGSTETFSPQVTAVLDSFPTNPAISGTTVSTIPTFTWGAPAVPPASYNYGLWVGGNMGNNWDAWSLPSSQLSAVYGYDGQASPLTIGIQYNWNISVRDQNGNRATVNSFFTPTVAGVAQPALNMLWGGVYHLTKADGTLWDVIDLGTNLTATSLGTLSATVTGPNGFNYTFTDADISPYLNGQLAVNKQYAYATAPLSPGVYTFTLDDGQGHVYKRVDTHANPVALPVVDSTTIQAQRKADGSYLISWAPVNDTNTYYYRTRIQTAGGVPVYLGSRSMAGNETIPAGTLVDGTAYQIRVEVSDAPTMDLMFNRSNSAFVAITPAATDYDVNRLMFSYANAYNRFEADGTQLHSFGFGFANGATDAAKVTAAVVTGPNGFSYTFQTADLLQPNGTDFAKNAAFSPAPAPGLYTFHVTANGLDHIAYATLTAAAGYPLPDSTTYQVEDLNNGSIRFSWADVNHNGALYYRVFVTDTVTGQYFTSGRVNQTFVDMTKSIFGDLTTKKWRVEVYDSSSGLTIRNRVNGPYTTAPLAVPAYDATLPLIGGFGIINEIKSNGTGRTQIWFGATDSDGTITALKVEGPNGYLRNLLTQGYPDGSVYRLIESGSPQAGLYKFTAVDNSGKTAVRYNYQPVAHTIPNVDYKTFAVTAEPNGDIRVSWAPVAGDIPLWYSLQTFTNTDVDSNGQLDYLNGTNLYTFASQTSLVIPASLLSQSNIMFRVTANDGSNGNSYNNRSRSVMVGYQGAGFNYASLTDTDGDGYASNVDANDNDAAVYPFAPVATDTVAPAIAATVPANNATGVSVNAPITITFSEAVQGLPDLTSALKNNSTGLYVAGTGSSSTDNTTHTFTPDSPLSPATTYSITFSTVTDMAGNALPVTTLTFTTAAAVIIDATPPVTTASPAGGVFTSTQNVTLAVNEAATTYFTTDGTVPTTASPVYTSPINISATTSLKFFSRDTAGNSENVKTVVYTFLPGGDMNGDGKVDISDAYKTLEIAVGRVQATAADLKNADVAPLVNGKPSPDGVLNVADVVVILRRIVGLVSW